ncbi:BnaC02g25770D [Brassica napus]|uniref:BnaC02g25770D protein n=1 Tax=Brassica napus TaxID=3708 RepID=A0A078GC52_BRANA|nr:BnaC02g25770D [Brassica napus]
MSVFPLNVKWRCMPISIIVCLSCGAVRSESEDATDFVSTVFRGADWVSTSHKVTISQVSGIAMKLASTHSSFSLSSLSTYLRGFSISIAYVVSSFVCKVCLNSFLLCSLNV